MLTLTCLFVLAPPPPEPPAPADPLATYATLIQTKLVESAPKKPTPGTTTLDVEVDATGVTRGMHLVAAGANNVIDDQARTWLLATEPFAAPGEVLTDKQESLSCLLRLAVPKGSGKPAVDVACFAKDATSPTFASLQTFAEGTDAGARLFAGFREEAAGDLAKATAFYQKAVGLEPNWDLAARALGLALVKNKRVPQAVAYLKTYVRAKSGEADALVYAKEIERFEKEMAARAQEFTRVRARLSQQDLLLGIKKGYPLLEPCLDKARRENLLAQGFDTLVLTWKVKKDGSVDSPGVERPDKLSLSDTAECIERTLKAWRFPPYSEGSEITAKSVPIKVRGSPPPKPVVAKAASTEPSTASEPEPEELSFSQCERPGDEVATLVRQRSSRIAACIKEERHKNPKASWPDNVAVSLVVDSTGPVRSVFVDHRFFRNSPFETCVAQALAATLPPSSGADCPAEFSIDLRR